MSDTLHLVIDGMHCGSCIRRVTAAVGSVEGAHTKEVSVGSATVEYDRSKANPDSIVEAVEDMGFKVTAIN